MSYPPPIYDGTTGEVSATIRLHDSEPDVTYPHGNRVHVPPGGLHGFRNESGAASMLLHFAPGAPREAYFEGLARAAAGEAMTEREREEFMRYHDNYWVD